MADFPECVDSAKSGANVRTDATFMQMDSPQPHSGSMSSIQPLASNQPSSYQIQIIRTVYLLYENSMVFVDDSLIYRLVDYFLTFRFFLSLRRTLRLHTSNVMILLGSRLLQVLVGAVPSEGVCLFRWHEHCMKHA